MKPRNLVMTLAVVASAGGLLPLAAHAQQKPLKEALVGSWLVTAVVDQYESGKQINNWGSVKGNMFFDAGGRFSQIIIGDAQPAMKTPDPRKPDAPVVAYYGSYVVNEGAGTVSFKVEAASYSARVGAPPASSLEIKGDTMTLIGSARKDQEGTFTPRVQLRRAGGF
jgi:hypothetical protein